MSDDDKLNRDITRGGQAQSLLNNELLQDAFAKLEADYLDAWKRSPARDTDGRERLWQAVQIVQRVKEHLGHVASGGKLAQKNLDELVKAEKAKRGVK